MATPTDGAAAPLFIWTGAPLCAQTDARDYVSCVYLGWCAMSDLRVSIADRPLNEDVKAMLKDWRIAVPAMFFGTLIILGVLAVVALLAYNGRSTEAVMVVLTSLILPILTAVLSKISTVQHHVNGNTSRLLDAAVGPARATSSPPAPVDQAPAETIR